MCELGRMKYTRIEAFNLVLHNIISKKDRFVSRGIEKILMPAGPDNWYLPQNSYHFEMDFIISIVILK